MQLLALSNPPSFGQSILFIDSSLLSILMPAASRNPFDVHSNCNVTSCSLTLMTMQFGKQDAVDIIALASMVFFFLLHHTVTFLSDVSVHVIMRMMLINVPCLITPFLTMYQMCHLWAILIGLFAIVLVILLQIKLWSFYHVVLSLMLLLSFPSIEASSIFFSLNYASVSVNALLILFKSILCFGSDELVNQPN